MSEKFLKWIPIESQLNSQQFLKLLYFPLLFYLGAEHFFDPLTLHGDLEISDRRDEIVNTKRNMIKRKKCQGIRGIIFADHSGAKKIQIGGAFPELYRGVRGDIVFKEYPKNDKSILLKPTYFEIKISFDIDLQDFKSEDTLFELGLTPKHPFEKQAVLKNHSATIIVAISRCPEKPQHCVMYWQEGKRQQRYNFINIDVEKLGYHWIIFGLKIDPNKRKVSVRFASEKDFKVRKTPFTHDFLNVSFSRHLYPVFGMTDKTFVNMSLLSKLQITDVYNIFGYNLRTPACEV